MSMMAVDGRQYSWPGQEFGFNKINFFQKLTQTFGVLSGLPLKETSLNQESDSADNDVGVQTENTFAAQLDIAKEIAEVIAVDVILNLHSSRPKIPPNKYCKTMRRVVQDMLERHDLVFKGMVHKLNLNDDNIFQTFVIVSDEIFADGEVNWGRIVALYAFAVKLAEHNSTFLNSSKEEVTLHQEKIAMFLGKYVACKLGQWMLRHGGWDAFVKFFPDHRDFEEKIWKGLVFTAIGFAALGTMVVSR